MWQEAFPKSKEYCNQTIAEEEIDKNPGRLW